MTAYVFDSSAVLEFFFGGEGARDARKIFIESQEGGTLCISALQAGEAYHTVLNRMGRKNAENFHHSLKTMGFRIEPIGETTAYLAAEIKNEFGLHMTDAVAAALAMQERVVLVSADRDFKRIGKRMKIRWVGV